MEKTRNDRLAEYVRKKHPGIEASEVAQIEI